MESNGSSGGQLSELFTDLDPLGTGKSKPYVDRKDFFSDMKTSSPKLASLSRDRSPVNMTSTVQASNPEPQVSNVGHPDQQQMSTSNVSSSCLPPSSSITSFVRNSSQRSSTNSNSRHFSGGGPQQPQQGPVPPPRSGSELTYGRLDQIAGSRNSFIGADTSRFGFSAQLTTVTTSSTMGRGGNLNPASNISTIASWRSSGSQSNSGIHDTRLYHTLGRPMTTFNRPSYHDILTTSEESSIVTVSLPDNSDQHQQHHQANQEMVGDSNRYGSIPQLEASPRKFRGKEHHEFLYSTNNNNLAVLPRPPADGASMSEIPPKLPEKPSKRSNQISPPPLPPKKPIKGLIGVSSYNRPQPSSSAWGAPPTTHPPPDVVASGSNPQQEDDIYDFPPMPMLGSINMDKDEARQCISAILQSQQDPPNQDDNHPNAEQQQPGTVSVEELSKMSLIELNSKLLAGQLPEELKGMSIMELIEYINQQTSSKAAKPDVVMPPEQPPLPPQSAMVMTSSSGMKPSFSDNFVCDMLPTNTSQVANDHEDTYETIPDSIGHQHPTIPESSPSIKETSGVTTVVHPGYPINQAQQEQHHQQQVSHQSGFDDDFTPFSIKQQTNSNLQQPAPPPSSSRPSSQATSDHSVLSQTKPDEYDKYAVFRELQMEEELIRAWKTPSEEEKEIDENKEAVDDENAFQDASEEVFEDNGPQHHSNELHQQVPMEHEVINQVEEPSSYKNQPVCSSEGSPCSRSDTQSPQKSFSVEDQSYGIEVDKDGTLPPNNGHGLGFHQGHHINEEGEEEEDEEEPSELLQNKRDSQIPIFHHNDEDDDSVSQSIKSDKLRSGQESMMTEEPDNLFNNAFGPNETPPMLQSKTWTTFEDEDHLEQHQSHHQYHHQRQQQQQHSSFTSTAHQNAFQDNFGDNADWSNIDETEEDDAVENNSKPKESVARQSSGESHSKCSRFKHRHAGSCSRGHSFENVDPSPALDEPVSYTDWWPPSAEAGVPLKRSKPVTTTTTSMTSSATPTTCNDAYSATPDHKSQSSTSASSSVVVGVWGEPQQLQQQPLEKHRSQQPQNVFGEPLQPHFKVFSKVVNPNGFDNMGGRSGTPNNSAHFDTLSDSDSGLMPKSDSVNIFGVQEDPFDDDFFH